jgi:hypothetical protein
MTERRLETRLLCADLVRIRWNVRTLEGVLEDISPQGACVQVEEQIPPGEAVSISECAAQLALFTGVVTYCVRRDCGYLLGIRFTGPRTWSCGVFEPQHLTDPEGLGM